MTEAQTAQQSFNGWSVVLSATLHCLLCAVILLLPSPSTISAVPEDSIDVEIVTSPPTLSQQKPVPLPPAANEIRATPTSPSTNPNQSAEPQRDAAVAPPDAPIENSETKFVKPSHMLSEAVLADRRSSQARQTLKQLAPADQVEQLCNLEAMAQVGAWSKELQPDRVVAYAMADPKLFGTDFVAEGAAVHSRRDWYRLQFKCKLNEDRQKVVAFEFLLGKTIPKEMWAEHNLPDEDGASD